MKIQTIVFHVQNCSLKLKESLEGHFLNFSFLSRKILIVS